MISLYKVAQKEHTEMMSVTLLLSVVSGSSKVNTFGVLKVWSEALSVLTQTVEPPHACRLKGDRPHRRSHFMTTPTHPHTLQNLQTLGVIWVSSVICSLLIKTLNAVSHNKTTKCIYCYWCVKHAQTHIDNTLTLWAVTGGEFRWRFPKTSNHHEKNGVLLYDSNKN